MSSISSAVNVEVGHCFAASVEALLASSGYAHAQVAAIMENAVRLGAKGLHGPRPVILQLTMSRFHALTFEAETRLSNAGVHNINFVIQVVDAKSGQVLVPPVDIDAAT